MIHCRRVVILISIMAALFALFSPFALADMDIETFGHWMGVALKAADITVQSTTPVVAPIADFIVNPFNITQDLIYDPINYAFPAVNLTTPGQDLESYLKRSSIQVRGDTITIDGVDYRDIWVTNDAAQALRTNVFDLQTAFEIASNSSGNFVSGAGSYGGIPVFNTSNGLVSQHYLTDSPNTNYSTGGFTYYFNSYGTVYEPHVTSPAGRSGSGTYNSSKGAPIFSITVRDSASRSVDAGYGYFQNGTLFGAHVIYYYPASDVSDTPFDFTWVSQNIPAETLSEDEGLHFLVPNNPEQFSDPVVQQNIRNFNFNVNNNFSFDTPINLSFENNYSLFDHLFDDIVKNINITKPDFGPYNEYEPTPVPTPIPEPSPVPVPIPTPAPTEPPFDQIGTSPWSVLEDWLRSIREYLQTVVFYLRAILQAVKDLPNQFSSIFDPDEGSFSTWLKTLLTGIRGILDNIADFLQNLANIIENGSAIFFKSLVDVLEDAFQPVLNTFKSLTSIWRYVVGWFASISGPFYWAFNALGSAGGYLLSPFYAIAAAAIVIAIYRRLGR